MSTPRGFDAQGQPYPVPAPPPIDAIGQPRAAEPTAEDCSAEREVTVFVRGVAVTGYACWYPQTGGYVGKCVVRPCGGCFEAYVWHDGEFPFNDLHDGPPAHLHHCDPTQFIEFGQFVAGLPGMEREP